jgi:hypothetical protein
MSDEFDSPEPQAHISPFWPMIIVIAAMSVFFGSQDYELNRQRGILVEQLANADQPVQQARYYANRYVSLMKDLAETAQKNAVAAQIIRDAAAQGWIQVHPNAGGTNAPDATAAPAAPAPTDSK